MKILCHRRHCLNWDKPSYRLVWGPMEHSLGDFITCAAQAWGLFVPLLKLGFLDSTTEAGEAFWSWPWNCKHGHGLYWRTP